MSKLDSNALVYVCEQTGLQAIRVQNVVNLLKNEDCTVPFIARYRKEVTGDMDEVQIRSIEEKYDEFLEIEKRRSFVLEAINKLEQLTPELEKKIKSAKTLLVIEDLYAPYKTKRKTKGMTAKEAGLEALAKILLATDFPIEQILAVAQAKFLNPDKKITTAQEAIEGACDIITEMMAHDSEIKEKLRNIYTNDAVLKSTKRKDSEQIKEFEKFRDYFEFEQKLSELKNPKATHRFLAMRRGMTLKILKVDVVYDLDKAINLILNKYLKSGSKIQNIIEECSKSAYSKYIHPSLDLEFKTELKKIADDSAINVFGINLRHLLLQPYLGAKCVLGADPGVRTGVKLAVVDDTGKFIIDTVVYPHPPHNQEQASAQIIDAIIDKFQIEYVAIGNGTYGRETLAFMEKLVPAIRDGKTRATLVNEDGASIYSASDIAREEFPDKDPTVRGAISIARRFQDPLAELVKIDPKSIGVGQYQHDVNQSKLKKSLTNVVESCVNYVGVDLNTASAPLLSYISGIGPSVAKNIVNHREKHGMFRLRSELLKIGRFSQKIFEQSAGFLRIYNGENALDQTFIHPERYCVLENWCSQNSVKVSELLTDSNIQNKLEKDNKFKEEVGEYTYKDIIKSLRAPGQDPRTEFKSTDFRKDVSSIEDLKIGEWYPGVVNNITQFGAFVDIGVKESGLLHVSHMSEHFVDDPFKELKVGEQVKVKIIDIDYPRKRISLSRKVDSEVTYAKNDHPNRKTSGKGKNLPGQNDQLKNKAFAGLKDLLK
ncbi:MAG: RNA-binding transcriptional accessory protein [Halobacteriovoraceae bacterium]|nr:RNA-binding transcriptional accessory protein [Halobacteriovoraceae bacterium]